MRFHFKRWVCATLALACAAGGADEAPSYGESGSDECVFRGPYELTATLTAGSTDPWQSPPGPTGDIDPPQPGCTAHAEYRAPSLQTTDTAACTAYVCVDGLNCIKVECERGDPVELCSAESTSGLAERQCEYAWALARRGTDDH